MIYTEKLSETQSDNLDVRISEIASKFGTRNLETMQWTFENHNIFRMIRTLINSEERRILRANFVADGCKGCYAFDIGMSSVEFQTGCSGCTARMKEINGNTTNG